MNLSISSFLHSKETSTVCNVCMCVCTTYIFTIYYLFTTYIFFSEMNKADQDEYMKLSNKYENIQALPMKEKSELRILLEQRKAQCETNVEQNWKMLKIFHIYETNSFQDCGVCIKISRFNHSCRPNANQKLLQNSSVEIRAMSNINEGEEITLTYIGS